MLRAVAYLRMSDPRQDTSLGDQRRAIATYAKAGGFRVLREYIDEGISGDATEKRVAFQRMIADASAGEFQVILAWDQDRFGRFDPLEAGYWIQPLRKAGVRLETVAQGKIDWNDFAGRIVYAVAQEGKHAYLRDLSRNVLRGMQRAAGSGKVMWTPPLGYSTVDGRCVPNDDAETVRRIFSDCLLGKTCRQIAVELNRDGVSKPSPGPWRRNSVRRILVNPTYTGVYRWGSAPKGRYSKADKPTAIAETHEAIVTREVFDECQARLKRNRRRTSPRIESPFILSGLIFCGDCGSAMYGRERRGLKIYQCGKALATGECQRNTVRETEVVELVAEHLADLYGGPKYREKLLAEMRALLAESKAAKSAAPQLAKQLAAVEAKIAKAEQRLLECETQFLPVVQRRLSELAEERRLIVDRMALASVKPKAVQASTEKRIAAAMDAAKHLSRVIHTAPPATVRDCLRELVQRVECVVATVSWGTRTVYRLESVKVIAPT